MSWEPCKVWKKKKQPVRNRLKICGKVFIPEKLFFTLLMIMGMMFSPSSRKGEKFGWNTWLSENDLHTSYVKKFHPSEVRKVILFTLVSFTFLLPNSPPLPSPPPLQANTEEWESPGWRCTFVCIKWRSTSSYPWLNGGERQPWTLAVRHKLAASQTLVKRHFSHCLFCQPKLTCPSVACLSFSFDLHHRW